jgi:SOS-response transcriptional repressor LexA
MKTMISRLKSAVKNREAAWGRRILKKDLATAAGVSPPAVTNWWNNENTELEARCIFGLSKYLGIAPEWLQSGRGSMLPVADAEENNAVSNAPNSVLIAESDPYKRHTITEKKSSAYGNVERVAMGRREIPVISYVQAGMMTEAIDPFSLGEGFETLTIEIPCSEQTFALRLKGRSMLPDFSEGDVVVFDPMEQPIPGSFVVAKNSEEEATFKKYRAVGVDERGNAIFELVPLNEDFATLHSQRDHLHIVAVAIEHRKKLLR